MGHKSKKVQRRLGGHMCPVNALDEIEEKIHTELSGKMHVAAGPPDKLPKKVRSSLRESYSPLHRK